MSPSRWHYRVPFFGEEINETAITCDGNRADVMGAELEYVAIVRVLPWLARRHPAPAQPAAQRIQYVCAYLCVLVELIGLIDWLVVYSVFVQVCEFAWYSILVSEWLNASLVSLHAHGSS